MEIIKNIFRVAMSNFINLGSSFIIGFILPVFLSISEYGMYREYTLFLTFLSLLNFGYNDGIYIKYGREKNRLTKKNEIKDEHSFILIFQIVIFLIMMFFSFYANNVVFLLFTITTFVNNVSNYHLNFYQAIGNFKIYSNMNIIRTIIKILNILIAIVIINSKSYIPYIIADILANIVIFIILEFFHYSNYGKIRIPSLSLNLKNFKVGIFILMANTIMNIIGNLGSWFVNIIFDIREFAYYSFATSILNIALMIVSSISLIFYNVIAQNDDEKMLNFVKRLLLLLGVISGLGFFVFNFIISIFMKEYIPALTILSVTFLAIPYIMVINVVVMNLYKLMQDELSYFKDMLLLLLYATTCIGLLYLLFKNIIIVAIATTIVYICWYLYSVTIKFNYLTPTFKENLLLLSHLIIFYILSNYFSSIIGGVLYLLYLLIVLLIFKEDIRKIIRIIRKDNI